MAAWATQKAFTIVELLIVIVIIAILAAITVVAYTGIQDRAYTASVENDLNQNAKSLELFRVSSSNDMYPSNSDLSAAGNAGNAIIKATKSAYTVARNNFYYCRSADGKHYALGVVSRSNQGYFLVEGVVSTASQGSVYQSDTCAKVGEPTSSGYAAYVVGGSWLSWVGGN